MPDILTTGELLIDFTPVKVEGFTGTICPNPGGAPANAAVQIARLGVSAGFIGKVGKDSFGASLRKCLEQNGVDTTNLVEDEEVRTTLAFVHLDENGDRSFTFYRNPGADTQLRTEEINMEPVGHCSILHFGSLSLTTEPGKTTTLELVKAARTMGKCISYDPNWRPALWKSEEKGIAAMKLGLELCHILKISQEELALLTGTDSIREGTAKLHEMGIILIVVTLGAAGCAWSYKGELVHQPTFDTKVVDTTGSGDSFWGAFLAQLQKGGYNTPQALQDIPMEQLTTFCRFANGAGSICASRPGGIPALADEPAIRACMEQYPLLQTGFELN